MPWVMGFPPCRDSRTHNPSSVIDGVSIPLPCRDLGDNLIQSRLSARDVPISILTVADGLYLFFPSPGSVARVDLRSFYPVVTSHI